MRRAALSTLSLEPFLPAPPEKFGSASRQIQPGVVKGHFGVRVAVVQMVIWPSRKMTALPPRLTREPRSSQRTVPPRRES